jgi:hypothetical protein
MAAENNISSWTDYYAEGLRGDGSLGEIGKLPL